MKRKILSKTKAFLSAALVLMMMATMLTPIGSVKAEEAVQTPEEVLEEALVKKRARSSDTVQYSVGELIPYHDVFTNVFTGTVNGQTGEIYCMNPSKLSPGSGSYAISYIDNNSALAKAMYYLYGGPGFAQGPIAGESDPNIARIYTHLAVSYLLDINADWWFGMKEDGLKQDIIDIANNIEQQQPAAPSSFKAYVFNLYQGTQAMIGSYNIPEGYLQIKKTSGNLSITEGNACYTLAGAEFNVMEAGTSTVAGKLTTDANGLSNKLTLKPGQYDIQETKAPNGYVMPTNPPKYRVTITADQLNDYYVNNPIVNMPGDDPIGMLVAKLDSETGLGTAQGGATTAGAQFTAWYYDGYFTTEDELKNATVKKQWILETGSNGIARLDEAHKISGDDFYYNEMGIPTLPWGTLVIQETKAPEGYLLETADGNTPKKHIINIKHDVNGAVIAEYNPPEQPDQIKRSDIEGVKVGGKEQKRLANITFDICLLDESGEVVESHPIVTDDNGQFSTKSSWNKHGSNTNRGETPEDGVWFGEQSALREDKGALVYGNYELRERRCENNEGYDLLKFKFSAYKDGVVIDLGTLTDHKEDVITLETMATGENGEKVLVPGTQTKIKDTVKYAGLKEGQSYVVKGWLMDKFTKKELLVDDKRVEATATFTPDNSFGKEVVEFTLDTTALIDKDIVVFEELYIEAELIEKGDDAKPVGEHKDITDGDQTVRVEILDLQTTATGENGEKVLIPGTKTMIKDVVKYSGLTVGEEYTVKGWLVEKASEEEIKVKDKRIEATATFVAERATGKQVVVFELDTTSLINKDIVVFEELYITASLDEENPTPIGEHKDIDDEGQTVRIEPLKLKTSAINKATGDKIAKIGGIVELIDEVTYEGLTVNTEYIMTATLMDKASNSVLKDKDGKVITNTVTFVPKEANGKVSVEVKFDSSILKKSSDIVFFEVLAKKSEPDVPIGSHEDINDKDQTISFKATDNVSTGDLFNIGLLILVGAIAIGGGVALIVKKRKRAK
ncbi:ribosomal protein S2 [Lachnospiraceae bacterium PF1-22]